MPYRASKIYYDGSHYIAVPKENFPSRKGWKYIGVWERSASERLHFHGIFYIPENAMIGELKQVSDYSTKQHRMQTTYQNTHFLRAIRPLSSQIHREKRRKIGIRRRFAYLFQV